MQARRNIDTDSKEVDKTATNSYSRSNTNKGDVGQYEEARIKSFRTGRLPFSDDEPETFCQDPGDYFRRKNDGDPSLTDDLKGKKFLMAVKEVRLPFQKICETGSVPDAASPRRKYATWRRSRRALRNTSLRMTALQSTLGSSRPLPRP